MVNCAYALIAALMTLLSMQCSAAAARLPFISGFESGAFGDWDGGLDSTLTITSQDSAVGSRSAQSLLVAGLPTDNYKEHVFGDSVRVGGSPVSQTQGLWLSFWSKFDVGFRFGSNSLMHKLAIINFEDENSRRRYQLIVNVQISTGEYFIEHLKWNSDRSFNRAFPGFPQNRGTAVAPRIGQWDHIKLHFKPNTPEMSDGLVQLWVNGRLQADYSNTNLREGTAYNPNKLIMSSYAQDATTAGVQRWDEFYLGENDPDSASRPRPPVLIGVQ